MTAQNKYPECEKLKSVAGGSQKLGEFLDWLRNVKGWELCTQQEHESEIRLCPVHYNPETLLAEYLDVDLDEVEKERQAMIAEMQGKAI